MGSNADLELRTYQHLAAVASTSKNPGRRAVRTLLDSFMVTGPAGEHHCLVHPPLCDSVGDFLQRNPIGRLPPPVLGIVLQRLFMALDFLHTECHLIHTGESPPLQRKASTYFTGQLTPEKPDLKMDNIMFGSEDDSVFEEFEQQELETPSPRKEVDGHFIYLSRHVPFPKAPSPPVLCDFGSVAAGEKMNTKDVQPDLYRSPEVILNVPWSYEIDIWNVGCMVRMPLAYLSYPNSADHQVTSQVWDMFEGGHLFTGRDVEHKAYRSRTHVASIIGLLGLPPRELVARGWRGREFFHKDGVPGFKISRPKARQRLICMRRHV